MKKKVKVVDKALIDFSKLSSGKKLLLYPIFMKLFGILQATVLLYGR